MTKKKKKITDVWESSKAIISTGSLLAFLLGYFQYGGFEGGFAMILVDLLLGLFALISIIPLGVIVYFILGNRVLDMVLAFTSMEKSWVTSFIFYYKGALGIIITIVIMLVIIGRLME